MSAECNPDYARSIGLENLKAQSKLASSAPSEALWGEITTSPGARLEVPNSFFNVKPGSHRSMWYGQTEQNVRELFAAARRARL